MPPGGRVLSQLGPPSAFSYGSQGRGLLAALADTWGNSTSSLSWGSSRRWEMVHNVREK